MKGKIIITILILFVTLTSGVHAERLTCKNVGVEGLCIELEFVSMEKDYKTPSKYEFPDLVKITDYLVLRKITVFNTPELIGESKDSSNVTLNIDAYPFELERKDIAIFEPTRDSTIHIPPLKVNDVYELTYLNEWGRYEAKLNNQIIREGLFSIYPKEVFTDGNWVIDWKIKESISYTILTNGEWRKNFFKVHSETEIANIETAEMTRKSLKWSWVVVVAPILVMLFVAFITVRKMDEQSGILQKVANNITTASKDQIKRLEEFEEDKRDIIVCNLIDELKSNQKFATKILEKDYKASMHVPQPAELFLTNSLIRVTKDLIVQDVELNKELMAIQIITEKINESIKFLRNIITTTKDDRYKEYIKESKQLIVRLKSVIPKLEDMV